MRRRSGSNPCSLRASCTTGRPLREKRRYRAPPTRSTASRSGAAATCRADPTGFSSPAVVLRTHAVRRRFRRRLPPLLVGALARRPPGAPRAGREAGPAAGPRHARSGLAAAVALRRRDGAHSPEPGRARFSMQLFDNAFSPYAFKVRAVLYGERRRVREARASGPPPSARSSAAGTRRDEVPALEDGEAVIYD